MNFLKNFNHFIIAHQKEFLLLIISVIFSLSFLEGTLRVFSNESLDYSKCTRLDKDFHHSLIPNSTCRFKTEEWDVVNNFNSEGLRDDEVSLQKSDKFRILALGDSFLMGYGVNIEDSMINNLEKDLKSSGKNVDIVNAGVNGYSPLIEYLFLLKKGLAYNPDMVLLFFTMTDFWDDRQRFGDLAANNNATGSQLEIMIKDGSAVFAGPQEVGLKSFLLGKSKIYSEIFKLMKKKDPVVQQDVIYQGDIDKDIAAVMRGNRISDSDYELLFELPIDHIRLIADLLDQRDIRFVVVAIPEAVQVSPNEWPGRVDLGFELNFHDQRGDWQDELGERLKALKIDFVNLLPAFRESKTFPLYFYYDGHFRESGHKLAAEIIFASIFYK